MLLIVRGFVVSEFRGWFGGYRLHITSVPQSWKVLAEKINEFKSRIKSSMFTRCTRPMFD